MCSNRYHKAFSLIELMAVIAVMAFLLALAAPTLLTLGSTSLSAGGRELAGFLNLARADAIAKNTVVRVMIVRDWPNEPEAVNRKFSVWKWDERAEDFVQSGAWLSLPEGLVIEPQFPSYVRGAEYAKEDPVEIRALTPNEVRQIKVGDDTVDVSMLDFMPNGRVRTPDTMRERKFAFVVIQGHMSSNQVVRTAPQKEGRPRNWAQVNIDVITGNIAVLRP